MIRFLFLIPVTILFLAAGCRPEPQKPDNLVQESVYTNLLAELYLTKNFVESVGLLEKEDSLQAIVFDHYDVTREQFEESHKFYQRQVPDQVARIDSVRNMLQRERSAMLEAENRANGY
ncbi:MAG: DUF4296 domain-containing protein [Balneolaceae bacterium]